MFNAGLNVATGDLVCLIDADTLIEPDAMAKMARPFLDGEDVLAVGGTIRIANECEVEAGCVARTRVPRSPIAGFQVVEYLRAFLFGRLGLALCGSLVPAGGLSAQARTAADSAFSRGDRPVARRLYLERLKREPDDATALFRLALLSNRDGRYRESVGWLDLLLRIQPEDREAKVARARAMAALGDVHGAVAIIDSVLAAWPADVGALQAKARFTAWDGRSRRKRALLSTRTRHRST